MAENLLTVAALRTAMEAELIRSKLEGAGISAVLVEPEQAAEGAPAGRIQVQVGPPDFERAMQLLFPIPTVKRPVRENKPPWKCPKCGENVLAQFPVCWKCGTSREGQPMAGLVQPLPTGSAAAGPGVAPPMPQTPAPPLPAPPAPMPAQPVAMPRAAAATQPAAPKPVSTSAEDLKIPPIPMPAPSPAVATKPSANGESVVSLAPRAPRTAEDEALKIIVPPWDPATGKRKSAEDQAADELAAKVAANDRAARRAWYAALFGIFPPCLVYSIWVVLVLGLTNRPLSRRGHRFFYGALVVNALLIAAFFAWFGRQR